MTEQRCSVLSAAEPLAATAALAHTWTMIENNGPWGSHAIKDAGIESNAEHTVVFTRHYTRPDRSRTWHWDGATFTVTEDNSTHIITQPTLFMCTNGKRDTCCAATGLPLVRALNSDHVFEVTHIGGHRFATTALLMPYGIVLGRLTEDGARTALAGSIPLDHYRGNSSHTRGQQAAEIAVRQQEQITSLPALTVLGEQSPFHVQHENSCWEVHVESQNSIARPESCGGEPAQGLAFVATSVQACTHEPHR